jgi:predicted DCC family thiol-disulfide oxidoreductase YuxK
MSTEASHPILLFDGVCNLCNRSIQWVLLHDSQAVFRFASLQSEAGQALLRTHNLDPVRMDSVVLVAEGKAFVRSDAALEALRRLGFPWSVAVVFKVLPRGLRDVVYDWVARNRYRWFGRQESCLLPRPEWTGRFL